MVKKMSIKKGLWLLLIPLCAATLMACGSGGSTASSEYSGASGKVGILLKDSPQDVPGPPSAALPPMSQLWVTMKSVSLKMAEAEGLAASEGTAGMEEDRWLTVFEGTAKYDLLTLQGDSAALMALAPLPADKAGYYGKARLELDTTEGQNCFYQSPEGIADDPLKPCTDSDAQHLIVPSGKIDIEFQPHIYLGQDTTQYIVFDFLPEDSIKVEFSEGKKTFMLRPEIHAYTMPTMMETHGWSQMKVEELEGLVSDVSGCDNPDLPDMLVLSPEQGEVDISLDITAATISMDDSDGILTCGLLQPGQEVKVNIHITSDGIMIAERVEIEEED